MTRNRWILVAAAVVVLLIGAGAAAFSGDDDDDEPRASSTETTAVTGRGGGGGNEQTATSAPPATQAPGETTPPTQAPPPPPDDPACQQIQIVLKLDVTDEQRAAIEQKLESLDVVQDWRFEEGTSDTGATYWLEPESSDANETIGQEFAMDGVTSVVFPNQVC